MSPPSHPAFVLQDHPCGKVLRFTARGLDFVTMSTIGPQLVRLAETHGSGKLHVDLEQVDYLTGGALGTLVAMHLRVVESGGELLLRNVNDFPYEQFQVTRLDTVLRVRPKRSEALALA